MIFIHVELLLVPSIMNRPIAVLVTKYIGKGRDACLYLRVDSNQYIGRVILTRTRLRVGAMGAVDRMAFTGSGTTFWATWSW